MKPKSKSLESKPYDWNFEVDDYINRFIPASPLHRLPTPISRFLGYRTQKKQDVGNILGAGWSLLGAFCGLAVIAAVFNNTSSIQARHPPALIASFGASAILEYNAIRSPLGQPRNALLGHTFSAIVGVGITKLFLFHPEFEKIKWIAGALACGISSAVMLLTNTIHPPGGASAVLAATLPEITDMGWYFVGLVMWGTTLMLLVSLVINNIQRQFPMYWWTPLDLKKEKVQDVEEWPDAQGGVERKKSEEEQEEENEKTNEIRISAFDVFLPEELSLNKDEAEFLEGLMNRLRSRQRDTLRRHASSSLSTEGTIVPSHSQDHDRRHEGMHTSALIPNSAPS